MNDPASVRRIIYVEIIIGTIINALIPTTIIWAIGLAPPQRVGGLGGLLHCLVAPSAIGTFAMTMAVTNVIRVRRRSGGLPTTPDVIGPARLLPQHLLPRALVMGLTAMILLVPVGAVVVLSMHVLPLSKSGFVLLNILFGGLVAVVMTPPIVRRALADPIRKRA